MSILLAAAMLLTAICPVGTVWAEDAQAGDAVEVNVDNRNSQNYGIYGTTVKSYLTLLADSSLMSVQYDGKLKAILVEYYSVAENDQASAETSGEASASTSEGESTSVTANSVSLQRIEEETRIIQLAPDNGLLPIWGGFYASEDKQHYFILTGQRNKEQDRDKTVFQITKYDTDWNMVDEPAELKNCNTTVPFDAGSARMAACGQYLIIQTCHSMYKSYDGLCHQANMTIQLDMDSMKITDSQTGISGIGYASHSFNQFVLVDGNQMATIDHGDTYPRSVRLTKFAKDLSSGRFHGTSQAQTVLSILRGRYLGDNVTYTSVGGFESSSSSYLVAGNSILQNNPTKFQNPSRDVFVVAVDKGEFKASSPQWLTTYRTGAGASTPHLVNFPLQGQERFLVLWSADNTEEKTKEVWCKAVDGKGNPIEEEGHEGEALNLGTAANGMNLSDCVPIVSGSSLLWSFRSNKKFYLCTLSEDLKASVMDSKGGTTTLPENWAPLPDDPYTPSESGSDGTRNDLGTPIISVPGSESSGTSSSSSGGEYTISFDANGGTIVGISDFATTNGRLSSFPTATREGYILEGWYTDRTGGTRMDSSTQFTQGTQLYAHWTEDTQREYTITFDANGGTINGSSTRSTVQQKLTDMPVAERDGYTFQGWQTADGAQVAAGSQFHQDTTVYAQWAQQTPEEEYTITFDANGGTINGSSSIVTANQKLPSLPSATRDGYTFKGWYTKPAGGTQISASQTFHADATVYAQWDAQTDDATASVKKVTLNSVKSKAKGKITVSWKRVSGASGYQVAYSKSKSFPSKKTAVKNVNAAYGSKTFSGLSKGKTYYVRVRAYKKVDGKKSYGKWSSVQKVTVKK